MKFTVKLKRTSAPKKYTVKLKSTKMPSAPKQYDWSKSKGNKYKA